MDKTEKENEIKPMLKVLLISALITGIAAWFLLFALPVFFYAIPDRPATLNNQQPQHTSADFSYSSTGKNR